MPPAYHVAASYARPLVGTVAALFRYPVKSMLGEQLESAELGERGLAGDRAYAVIDREDGRVASGKHPRKWARLLELRASYPDGPGSPALVSFPDGTAARTGDTDFDERLSHFLGRDVTLASHAGEGQVLEEVWPAIDGLAPAETIEAMSAGRREGDDPVSDVPISMLAPAGTFFDLATLHVLTTATLARLRELAPSADFDVRRYRPNVLVDTGGTGFVENDWAGSTLTLGETAQARVDMQAMRCVMTTLAHGEVPADRATLQAIAKHNRIEIANLGTWACAGVYATITSGGTVNVGDAVDQLPSL
jgi:uncharacterized protein